MTYSNMMHDLSMKNIADQEAISYISGYDEARGP
jgi:predicted DNA-binding protein YlxM (UPF0122 family)